MTTDDLIQFTAQTAGERLDKAILAQIGDRLSRAQLQTLIADGFVQVNGDQLKCI